MNYLLHFLIIVFFTATTQVGGLIYLLSIIVVSRKRKFRKIKRFITFLVFYTFSTFLIIPKISPYFGRLKINDNANLKSHNFITKLCNRNYVTPKMNEVLLDVSQKLNTELPNIKLIYLDANFPFFDGFPLLPHLSHNDGKKIDITFIYENTDKSISNLKVSNSGYGVFENPKTSEINQTDICKQRGYWQYDFTKYLTFGSINSELQFSNSSNKKLINLIVNNRNVSKLFIEPHLKNRLHLKSSKIRFHGCKAVRHDDHIHFQIH